MGKAYESPVLVMDDGDTPTPYICNAPVVGVALYAAIIMDVVLFINWGGYINLAAVVNATTAESKDA